MERGVDWGELTRFYEDGHSVRKICDRFGISARAWRRAVADGLVPEPELPPMPASEKRALIERLFREGYSQAMIAAELGMSKATVSYHARRFGVPVHDAFARRYDWEEVQRAHDSGMRALECCRHFGFTRATWCKAVAAGRIQSRSHLIPLEQLLVKGRRTNRTHLKGRLLAAGLKENKCEQCGISTWLGKPLNVQLHHKNGDGTDNRLSNIAFLCPNCHSQTDTYGGAEWPSEAGSAPVAGRVSGGRRSPRVGLDPCYLARPYEARAAPSRPRRGRRCGGTALLLRR